MRGCCKNSRQLLHSVPSGTGSEQCWLFQLRNENLLAPVGALHMLLPPSVDLPPLRSPLMWCHTDLASANYQQALLSDFCPITFGFSFCFLTIGSAGSVKNKTRHIHVYVQTHIQLSVRICRSQLDFPLKPPWRMNTPLPIPWCQHTSCYKATEDNHLLCLCLLFQIHMNISCTGTCKAPSKQVHHD